MTREASGLKVFDLAKLAEEDLIAFENGALASEAAAARCAHVFGVRVDDFLQGEAESAAPVQANRATAPRPVQPSAL